MSSERPPEANGEHRAAARVDVAALAVAALAAAALAAVTLAVLWPRLNWRADLLMWGETDMVGNLIKLETGRPIFGPPADSNSLVYMPGASLLTYAILRLTGQPLDVPAMRAVQLVLVTLAALVATGCAWRLARLVGVGRPPRPAWLWHLVSFLLLWLAATSPLVNKFVLTLHTDAAALLVSTLGFWLALGYLEAPGRRRLTLLAAIPAAGYFVKQLLAAWAPALTLLVAARAPRAWRRWLGFGLVSALGVALVVGVGYLVWGDPFLFWTFTVVGGARRRISLADFEGIALLRSLDHLLLAWSELGLGVAGAVILLRGSAARAFAPIALAWLLLVASQTLASGSGWSVLYYFGPSVVLGTCFLLAALAAAWERQDAEIGSERRDVLRIVRHRLPILAGLTVIVLALRVVPSRDPFAARPLPRGDVGGELERYAAAIEAEAEGVPPSRLLMSHGSWIYLRHRHLAKDRAVSLADQPVVGIYENFAGLLDRIRTRQYDKILVLNLHEPHLSYDWQGWPRPSGVRAALAEHYVELHTIPAAQLDGRPIAGVALAGPVSVLVPKPTD